VSEGTRGVKSVRADSKPHRVRAVAAALFAVALLISCRAGAAPLLAIEHVTIVDVAHGRTTAPRTVLIKDGRIAAIAAGDVHIPRDATRLDGRSKFLIPGLIDLHVHLFNNASHRPANEWAFPLFVANGVTGVREMNTTPDELMQVAHWREAVDRGELIAPSVLAAGVFPRGDTDAQARQAVREAAQLHADFIKVFSEVAPSRWRAILDEARTVHMPVDGHVPAAVSLAESAQAGQRTAEHLMQAYEACSSREREMLDARRGLGADAAVALRDAQERDILASFDAAACRRAAKVVAAAGQAQVLTIVLEYFDPSRPRDDFTADPRWPLLRADEQARWRRILEHEAGNERELAELRWSVTCSIVRTFAAAGATLLAGTDAPMPLVYPGYALHDELEQLVACGLSNARALRAATSGAARLLKLPDTGRVQRGARADLVLLDADPLRDVRNLRRIHAVVLAGRLLQRAQLDALLATP